MSVTGVTTNLGGFIGYLYNDFSGAVHSTITFDSDSATGNVAGDGNVGGFLGGTDGSGLGTYVHHTRGTGGLIITNSSASGTVTGNLLGDNASNAGGFVGYLSCKSGSASQFSACTLRQNSASGNVTGYRYVGGFMGQMDGDINLEDNYSTGNVTGERDTGGFLGTLNSEFGYANVSRVYASSTVTTSGGSPSNIAGLIGSAQSSNSNTNIDHAFAIASLVDGSGAAHPGWMVGNLSGITPIDLAYSPISGPATACIQSDPSASFCTAHADPTYFYTATNDPLSNWNFSTIWQAHASSSYPTFRFSAVVIDASAPEISFVTAVPETSNAQITWTTNEPASTNIAYSLDSSYGTYTGLSDTFPRTLSHRVLIAGLPPCTTYHFTVTSADRLGSASTSSPSTFTTAGCSGGGSASRGSAGGGGGGGSSSGSGGGGGGGSVRDWITITPVQTLLPTSTPVITANTSTSNQPVTTSESSRDSRSGSNQGSATTGRQCFSYTFTKDLKTGSNSPDVKQLQIFLNRHESPIAASSSGSLSNETTYFGPSTKRALAVFQRAHQLPTDGLFASTTRTFIQNAMPSTTCPVIQVFGRSLKQGMSGVDVRALQRFLKVSETSFFGAATRKALQAFQDARHLPTTGTLDTATRTLLNNLVNT
jgi:peptidoglycan hydrolase-like protein with peptidoglycan-binding domain